MEFDMCLLPAMSKVLGRSAVLSFWVAKARTQFWGTSSPISNTTIKVIRNPEIMAHSFCPSQALARGRGALHWGRMNDGIVDPRGESTRHHVIDGFWRVLRRAGRDQ
jgi:hypothetical protein